MDATPFDRDRVTALLSAAGERLDGDWLLLGGALAAVWFHADRRTEDVDIIGLRGDASERLQLLELAASEGLPIESVNSAADYFVRLIADWRERIVVLHRGTRATIWRPTAELFLMLKARRLSEIDLQDCLGLLAHCAASDIRVDAAPVVAVLDALPATNSPHAATRRETLRDALRVRRETTTTI